MRQSGIISIITSDIIAFLGNMTEVLNPSEPFEGGARQISRTPKVLNFPVKGLLMSAGRQFQLSTINTLTLAQLLLQVAPGG
jgi:hypothetical protein